MIDPWFSSDTAPLLALFALFALVEYLQPLASQGRHRGAVLGLHGAIVLIGAALVVAGAAAWLAGQPTWVWASLALAGSLLAALMARATLTIHRLYEEAELRRSIATDL